MTYRDLDEQSNRVANGLRKLGVRKGDRVCILADNSPEFYYAYFGIIKIGGIAGPVNCWWQTGEIQYLLNDSGAVALFWRSQLPGAHRQDHRCDAGPEARHRTRGDR
ncbi:MAG: long-chain fatty acid--CoA ligase [Candidatus Moduliflexus flocculans]|nr:long-chain fatty acid--CoA ligase [Candidatus Moduliflexus flocculans]